VSLTVNIFGLGYIGLPTAILIASKGIKVRGIDINKNVINKIARGKVHINEPGLEKLLRKVITSGFLSVSENIDQANIHVIAVPTPFKKNFTPDLRYINNVISALAPFLNKENLIILESTSPVGTTEKILKQ